MNLRLWLDQVLDGHQKWTEEAGPYEVHDSLRVADTDVETALHELADRLRDNYPYFHPRYAGQMLKPPHPAAVAGYVATMLVNPNNHSLDGGPATARMEKEVMGQLAAMFGLDSYLGHLTTSGTIANLEALYVARQYHPDRGVAFSADSHYTHARMCGVLGMTGYPIPTDNAGRMDLAALEKQLLSGTVGTVVVTAGTTGLGAIDPVHEVLEMCTRFGVRVHVDAAYGGFFTLLAGLDGPEGLDPRPWSAISRCDSIVIDPHKHGLQPYGCGAVLFRDPATAQFFTHDSPYTYYTSKELHLGEISLECSRSGASAAALWLTLKLFPPTPDGLGQVLAAGRRAALNWSRHIEESEHLALYQPPDLDIVTYFPRLTPSRLSHIDAASARILHEGMAAAGNPVFVSLLRATAAGFTARHSNVIADISEARILRSVLMKPESENYVGILHSRIEELATAAS
ncbi:pyridoxal phosphate-dependent decarboxylase family protein [Streptomyces chartreusis]|uniref:pyridoxal phosphate-dependent decarboxylase family protein n=1 Tax=Streptomyces chartreusis TaxID=1969 RepID=UPI0035DFDC48